MLGNSKALLTYYEIIRSIEQKKGTLVFMTIKSIFLDSKVLK